MFGTRQEARQFANRHAEFTTPREMPLKWEDADDSTTVATQLGDYVIMPIGDE